MDENTKIDSTRKVLQSVFLSDLFLIGATAMLISNNGWKWYMLPALILYANFSLRAHLDAALLNMVRKGKISFELIDAQIKNPPKDLDERLSKCIKVAQRAYFFAVIATCIAVYLYLNHG